MVTSTTLGFLIMLIVQYTTKTLFQLSGPSIIDIS